MLQRAREAIKRDPLLWYMLFLITIKIFLAGGLYITAYPGARHDDGLMVDMAYHLLNGEWLGEYDQLRLVKGITFPAFLALNHIIGLPYHITNVLLYGLVCVGFIKTLKGLIQNRVLLAAIFTILYFIPANIVGKESTRVYRDALLPTLVLLVFTCFLKMYFTRRKRGFLSWAICAGMALGIFWNLREDSIWLLPFAVAVILITIIKIALENKKELSKWFHINLVYALIPLLILNVINTGIKAINNQFYGTFTRNELSEGAFPQLIKALFSIAPEEDIFRVSVPRSTIEKVYEVSPMFRTLQDALDRNYGRGWDTTDGETDGQIKDGWFFWCLRDCIAVSGYDTPEKAGQFCKQAAFEIQEAIINGQLPKRSGPVMPSALMAPWKDAYSSEWPQAISDAFWYIAAHGGDTWNIGYSVGAPEAITRVEVLTHELALRPPQYALNVKGWIVSMDDSDRTELALYQGDNYITTLRKGGGQDVYDHYAAQEVYLQNAKTSRFNLMLNLDSKEELQLAVIKNGVEVDRMVLLEEYSGTGHSGDGYHWHLDLVSLSAVDTVLEKAAAPRISIIKSVNSIYQICGKLMTIIGLISYCLLTAGLLYEAINRKQTALLDPWLITTALLGSVMVLCIGLSYTNISAYNTLNAQYTAGGKVFLTAFDVLSIVLLGQEMRRRFFVNPFMIEEK